MLGQKILYARKLCVQKNVEVKKMGPKYFLTQKEMLSSKTFGSKISFWSKTFLVQENVVSKIFVGPNNFESKKKLEEQSLGFTKFLSKKYRSNKFLTKKKVGR